MDPLSVLGGATEAATGAAQQAQPAQPQSQQQMAPGVAPSQSFVNERPKSMWHSMVMGALQGLANSGGATSFGAGVGRGAQGVMVAQQQEQATQRQKLFDEQEIRFRDAQAAKMTAEASTLNAELMRMPEEFKLRIEGHQLKIADFLASNGFRPTMILDDDPAAAQAALVQLTRSHNGIPAAHVLHVGGKLAVYAAPTGEDSTSLDYVNKVRTLQNMPRLNEKSWTGFDAKTREQHVLESHSIFFPSGITNENAESEYHRRKLLADNFERTFIGSEEEKAATLSALRAAGQMVRDVANGNVQAKLRIAQAQAAARRKEIDPDELKPSVLSKVTSLASQFDSNPVVKNLNEQANKADSVKRIVEAGLGGPGDLAVVYETMKALDPSSVVRESEYESASKSGNVFAGSMARFNGYFKAEGGKLPDNVKQAFLGIIDEKMKVSRKQVKAMHADFSRRIEKITGKPNGGEYLTDYSTLYSSDDSQSGFSVTDPRGVVHNFSSQEDANKFKQEAGIR
jgi:hypothetical protein